MNPQKANKCTYMHAQKREVTPYNNMLFKKRVAPIFMLRTTCSDEMFHRAMQYNLHGNDIPDPQLLPAQEDQYKMLPRLPLMFTTNTGLQAKQTNKKSNVKFRVFPHNDVLDGANLMRFYIASYQLNF